MTEVAGLCFPRQEVEEDHDDDEMELFHPFSLWCRSYERETYDIDDVLFSDLYCHELNSYMCGKERNNGDIGYNDNNFCSDSYTNCVDDGDRLGLTLDLFDRQEPSRDAILHHTVSETRFSSENICVSDVRVIEGDQEVGEEVSAGGLELGLGFDTNDNLDGEDNSNNGRVLFCEEFSPESVVETIIDDRDDDEGNRDFNDETSNFWDAFQAGSDPESVLPSFQLSRIPLVLPLSETLRVVDFGSEYCDENEEQTVGINMDFGESDELNALEDDLGFHLCWDCLKLDDPRESDIELEWEEVNERIEGRDILNIPIGTDEDEEHPVFETQSEIHIQRESIQAPQNLDWEILLYANSLDRRDTVEADLDENSYLGASSYEQDDNVYTAEYEILFGQFAENEFALKGSPPASKSVVESLPSVFLTQEDFQRNNAICAVCKVDISKEETVTRLPCSHHYHKDCILPWLSIRNTCPVCRHELPTDDPEWKEEKAGENLNEDLLIRYNFEIFSVE